MGRALEGLGGRREGGVSWRRGGWTSKRQWLEELSTEKRGVLQSRGRGCAKEQRRCGRGGCAAKEGGFKGLRGLLEMQGYGEVGKVRGKMDIFWTSLTKPWWKSSKPKISGG